MKNNEELQKDVQDAIKWEPLLNAAEIGVIAKDGIVTLTGIVDTYAKKSEAEEAAKNVAGVKAVVEKITVRFGNTYGSKDDNEIAIEVLNSLKWNWQVPNDKIKVEVENGWITLYGTLEHNYQKEAVTNAVKNLLGVTGLTNNTTITNSEEKVEKAAIESAFKRNWSIPESDIDIEVSGHKATLKGAVDSHYQKEQAGRIAGKAPGVWSVDNELTVNYDYSLINI